MQTISWWLEGIAPQVHTVRCHIQVTDPMKGSRTVGVLLIALEGSRGSRGRTASKFFK